jgi:tyrosyl-tRNA synthetase
LAVEIITGLFSISEATQSEKYFEETFQKRNIPSIMNEYSLGYQESNECKLSKILIKTQLSNGDKYASSLSEVRRLISQNAVSVNGLKIDEDIEVKIGDEIRVGRYKFLRIIQ